MKTRIAFAIVMALSALVACKRESAAPPAANPNGDYRVEVWPLPAAAGSMSPDLAVAPGGRLLLSWINRQDGRRNALQFSSYTDEGGWQSQPRTIAVGHALVANWADTPHILATADGALWTQWLQSSEGSPSGYDTVLARSRDGGMRWEQVTRVNDDGLAAEHGFAALWPAGVDTLGIAWLDGRAQAQGEGHHGGGAMQLRANVFDMSLNRGADAQLDTATCDCCQTDVAITNIVFFASPLYQTCTGEAATRAANVHPVPAPNLRPAHPASAAPEANPASNDGVRMLNSESPKTPVHRNMRAL